MIIPLQVARGQGNDSFQCVAKAHPFFTLDLKSDKEDLKLWRLFEYVCNTELDLLCDRIVGEDNKDFPDDEDGEGSNDFDAWLSDGDDAFSSI